MNEFTLDPAVYDDLAAIWDYIGLENFNPAAAHRLIHTLFDKFALLATQPLMGEARDDLGKSVRTFVARPFVILYRPPRQQRDRGRPSRAWNS